MPTTEDRDDPRLENIKDDGQQEAYLVLSQEEIDKGFVRPVRNTYIHIACGTSTTMGTVLSETIARDPKFYGGTMCVSCKDHFPFKISNGEPAFLWEKDNTPMGD